MRDRDAKVLNRWCYKHNRQHERVHFPAGGASTMCPDCAREPEFAKAMEEMIKAAQEWAEQGFPPKKETGNEMTKGDSNE
jgi:hypothetical protein